MSRKTHHQVPPVQMWKKIPFPELKILFIDFAYHPITKFINDLCIVFHSLVLLLQLYFVHENFSVPLILRYGCSMVLTLYVSCS